MRPLRILVVTTDFPPAVGGIQEWTAQIASHLAGRHEVTVIAPLQRGSGAYDVAAPFGVVRFPPGPARPVELAALALTMLREVLHARPDVVLFTHVFAAVAGSHLCRRLRLPYVVVAHAAELQARRVQRFLRGTIEESYRCIAVSSHTAAMVRSKGVSPAAVAVIGCGVPASLLTAASGREDSARRLPRSGTPVILTVARLDERYKGHDTMLHALPLIAARLPQVTYIIAGDGRYRAYYEDLTTALGVQDRVIFTGRVGDDERLALYDRCDVLALLSREERDGSAEGFGIVFLEAAARGKPAVGGRSGGIPDAVVDGVTGLLVEPADVEAIADTCVRLLSDHDLARRLGEAGRERVRAAYTWEHIARQVEDVMLTAANKGHSTPTKEALAVVDQREQESWDKQAQPL